MAKKLKLWNGRLYCVLPCGQWKGVSVCVAAYSRVDVREICFELGLNAPSDNERHYVLDKPTRGHRL